MGVVNIFSVRPALFSCCIFFTSACNADVDAESIEIFKHVSRNILKATDSHNERVGYCDELITSSRTPKFNQKVLATLNATRHDVMTAVAFLKFNNDFLCQRQTRLELAFHLGTMATLKREFKIDPSSVEKLQSMMSYPPSYEIEYEVNYLKLPQSQRSYFESIAGDKPFDLVKAIDLNNLTPE